MTIKEALLRLPEARRECNALIREIKSLNDFINSKGGHPERKNVTIGTSPCLSAGRTEINLLKLRKASISPRLQSAGYAIVLK